MAHKQYSHLFTNTILLLLVHAEKLFFPIEKRAADLAAPWRLFFTLAHQQYSRSADAGNAQQTQPQCHVAVVSGLRHLQCGLLFIVHLHLVGIHLFQLSFPLDIGYPSDR